MQYAQCIAVFIAYTIYCYFAGHTTMILHQNAILLQERGGILLSLSVLKCMDHGATPDLRLPSHPHNTTTSSWPVLISHPVEGRRLGWPEWLLTY